MDVQGLRDSGILYMHPSQSILTSDIGKIGIENLLPVPVR